MRIPRSYVERYSRGLNRVSEQGRAALADALSAIDLTGDVADVRERVVAVMQTYCGASSTMAARLAADFYDGLRSRFGIEDGFRAEVDGGYEPEATDGAVRAFAQDLVEGRPDSFVGKCADRLDREVRLSANQCIERNARRDPKKPRWARVPTGPETCEFCIMLASRGFVYHSEELASHAHAHCDCRVVPSWDKAKAEVEGYDPDLYLDMWQHPERYEGPQMVAELDLRSDGLIRQEGGASEGDLPRGSMDAMVSFADGFNARYPALRVAEGTYPMGLSSLTVCTTEDIMAEGGISADEARNALGMFMKAKDGSFNAGIYMNADLLSSSTLEEVVSDFRHEYGHYVGWFIERSGAGSVEGMVQDAMGKFFPNGSVSGGDLAEAMISADLSAYAGESWLRGLPGEVFAEAFRVWQEGGESRIAAILGPMIDAALRGVA